MNQALKKSIVAYIGAAIGILSQLWIYPLAFDVYGDYQFVLAMITFFMPWASFGILGLNNRFFPYFEKENGGSGFFTLQVIALIVMFIVFVIFVTVFHHQYFALIEYMGFDVEVFKRYNTVILSSVFFLIFLTFLCHYVVNLKEVVVPYVISVFSWKIILPILILLLVFSGLEEETFFKTIPYIYAILALLMLGYINSIQKIKFSFKITNVFKENYKSMLWFAGYGLLSSYGYILAYTIDKIMVRGYTTDYNTGIYSMMVVLSGVILYPYDSIVSVATPTLSKNWKENKIDEIKKMNRKTTNVLSFITPFIFFLAYLNIEDIASFTTNKEAFLLGVNAFFFLGCAKVVNGLFGLNFLTLNFSKHYFVLFFATLILGIVNVFLNSVLIPKYGMTGAAIASLVALVSTNVVIFVFNWVKYGVQPFTLDVFKVLGILILAMIVAQYADVTSVLMINIILRSLVFFMLSVPLIYYLKLVPELNTFLGKISEKFS